MRDFASQYLRVGFCSLHRQRQVIAADVHILLASFKQSSRHSLPPFLSLRSVLVSGRPERSFGRNYLRAIVEMESLSA